MDTPSRFPIRRTADLLRSRVSIPGAVYFLTLCEAKRRASLTHPAAAEQLRHRLDELHASDFTLIAAVVMSDHVHLLGTLGHRLSLARTVGKFKAATRDILSSVGAKWQENFYDHHLRTGDELEPIARYMFLNPYRADLSRLDARWPFWWRWGDLRFEFERVFDESGQVPAAWMSEPDPLGAADY